MKTQQNSEKPSETLRFFLREHKSTANCAQSMEQKFGLQSRRKYSHCQNKLCNILHKIQWN